MKNEKTTSICCVGRRKTSVANLLLVNSPTTNKENLFLVNGRNKEEYFQHNFSYLHSLGYLLQKLEAFPNCKIVASVKGGGLNGQADAIKLALARALCELNVEEFRPCLKKEGYLSRDARIKERRKYGLKKARKASQSSKR